MTKRWFAWTNDASDWFLMGLVDGCPVKYAPDGPSEWHKCSHPYSNQFLIQLLLDKCKVIEQNEMPTVAQVKEVLGL